MNAIFKPDAVLERLILPQALHLGVSYVPSQFVLPFSHNGRQYVFHVLTKQLIEGTIPDSAHAGEGFDDLIKAMFLVPEGKDECAYYESVAQMMRLYGRTKGVPAYTIMPTLGCNARCVYCYEEGRKPVRMTPEIVEQTIRYLLKTRSKEEITISWFGGEPLLCPDIIDHICDRLREENVSFQSIMVTNGSLITPGIIDKMLTRWNLKRLQISLDGAEQDYIARKRYYAVSDQYHSVLHTIGQLSEAGIRVAIRVNIDEGNWPGIPQLLDDMDRFVGHKEHVTVYFSPLMDVRAGENDLAMWKKITDAAPLIEKAGFHALAYLRSFRRFRANRCMADSGSEVIGPDGSLYPCEHCPPESRFGDIFNGTTDEQARTEFCRTDRTREMCRKCVFLPDCTSFASCPWVDAHCKEARMMNTLTDLRHMLDQTINQCTDQTEEPDDEDNVC